MFVILLATAAIAASTPAPVPQSEPDLSVPTTIGGSVRTRDCKPPECIMVHFGDLQALFKENQDLYASYLWAKGELAKPKKCSVGVLEVLEPGRK